MKALIVCDSRAYGITRRVVEAIADALGTDVVTPHEARRIELAGYDLVRFGSGIRHPDQPDLDAAAEFARGRVEQGTHALAEVQPV